MIKNHRDLGVLTATYSYWQLLTATDSYWQLLNLIFGTLLLFLGLTIGAPSRPQSPLFGIKEILTEFWAFEVAIFSSRGSDSLPDFAESPHHRWQSGRRPPAGPRKLGSNGSSDHRRFGTGSNSYNPFVCICINIACVYMSGIFNGLTPLKGRLVSRVIHHLLKWMILQVYMVYMINWNVVSWLIMYINHFSTKFCNVGKSCLGRWPISGTLLEGKSVKRGKWTTTSHDNAPAPVWPHEMSRNARDVVGNTTAAATSSGLEPSLGLTS